MLNAFLDENFDVEFPSINLAVTARGLCHKAPTES